MTKRDIVYEKLRRRARVDLLAFIQYVWWMKTPFRIGRHTRALCNRLNRAVFDWLDGKSTFIVTNMPYRHGKSDIVSRALPAFFLGVCSQRNPDVIMSGYGTSLVKGFSKKVQAIMRSKEYQHLFPGVLPSKQYHAADDWQVEGSVGTVTAVGIGGSITGKGGHLIVLDDYCKNREEAESKTIRDKMWASFSDDLMTRANAPAAIVVVCATRWHEDDIVGRIFESMKKDPDYPKFESLVFPAKKKGPEGWDTLFPEMYNESWYRRQRAQLGSYSAAALLDCDPIGDEMKVFKDDWLNFYSKAPARTDMNVYAFVDGANSKKESADFTTIWIIGYGIDQNYYILDGCHDRMSLTERTDSLFNLVRKWRPSITFYEQVGAMSDVPHVKYVQDQIGWHFPIIPLPHRISKDDRIRTLVPVFEAGRMWMPYEIRCIRQDKSAHDIIDEFLEDEYRIYPACRHDDMIDPLADICDEIVRQMTTFPEPIDPGERVDGRLNKAVTEWTPF